MPTAETTTVEVKIPVAWSAMLGDQTRLMEILSLGLEEYRLRQAMTLYRTGDVSLANAAVSCQWSVVSCRWAAWPTDH